MPSVPLRDHIADALFHPDHGYYTANIKTVGRRGDFSTSATVGDALARAVAAWVVTTAKTHPKPLHLIEVGAGDGSLAASVNAALPWLLRRRLRFHIVEASPVLAEQQKSRLGTRPTWHGSMPGAIAAVGGNAIVISNELVDAFPPTIFHWDATTSKWLEVFIDPETKAQSLHPAVPDYPPPTSPHNLPDGQRIEVHHSYHRWLTSWVPQTNHLTLLTVDYGDSFPALYHRRPTGTLRAYYAHQRFTGPEVFQRHGLQDITTDVSFSALQEGGNSLGLSTSSLTTQRDFIRNHLALTEDQLFSSPSLTYLLDPYGPGTAFKLLIQEKIPPQK